MAEVIPFRGVLFNIPGISTASGDDLLAPPYDIITPEYREELYRKSPYNIVRIDFGREEEGDGEQDNRYTRAKAHLGEWLRENVLTRSGEPCFYSYEISYSYGGASRRLRGFLGLVRLEELGKGSIHPHECTHSKPKKDRLDLMRSCGANISPIFSIYNSPEKKASRILGEINKGRPFLEARDRNGAVHRVWPITGRDAVEAIRKELEDKEIFIADGHHRYETSLEYQRERRAAERTNGTMPYDYTLMFLANMADEGLTILPTHRIAKSIPPDALTRLGREFEVEEVSGDFDIGSRIAGRRDVFGFYSGGDSWFRLSYTGSGVPDAAPALQYLDVTVLHDVILTRLLAAGEISYEMDVETCLRWVREGTYAAAFFLNPTRVEDVEQVAKASLRMPPKSTYFYPKLLTGVVLNIFENAL